MSDLDMDDQREGGFRSEPKTSPLDGWVARSTINQNRGGQGWGVGRREAGLL